MERLVNGPIRPLLSIWLGREGESEAANRAINKQLCHSPIGRPLGHYFRPNTFAGTLLTSLWRNSRNWVKSPSLISIIIRVQYLCNSASSISIVKLCWPIPCPIPGVYCSLREYSCSAASASGNTTIGEAIVERLCFLQTFLAFVRPVGISYVRFVCQYLQLKSFACTRPLRYCCDVGV